MQKFYAIVTVCCLLIGLAGCNANRTFDTLPQASNAEASSEAIVQPVSESLIRDSNSQEPVSQIQQVQNTSPIPERYFDVAEQQGQVIRVEYGTFDYTGAATEAITKPAYVYLPHGYDENDTQTRYDVLYLMHGLGGSANNFLGSGRNNLSNILDNMIAQGDIPPMIAVSATFDAENQAQNWSRSLDEIAAFHDDFRNDLVVYIEGRFHTYAQGTMEADFQDSREHRAFAGFSLGAVTTWYQFVYNLDYVKYFVPMSGDCWILGTYGGLNQPVQTTVYLENIVQDGGWGEDDFLIYSGIGTADPIWNQVDSQMQEMLKSTVFTPNNLRHAIKENGRHDMDACEEYLYHALPIFFGGN